MEPIKTQDVWVRLTSCFTENVVSTVKDNGNKIMVEKKSDMVVMSKLQFITLIGDAFDSGGLHHVSAYNYNWGAYPSKTEYINQLIK